jgi:hypothetical protein
MRKALFASITALAALGMLGGCLVLARNGFMTSSKRGGWQMFVPAPQAYMMAAIMFALSGLAVFWLLQQTKLRTWGYVIFAAGYIGVACIITRALRQTFQ